MKGGVFHLALDPTLNSRTLEGYITEGGVAAWRGRARPVTTSLRLLRLLRIYVYYSKHDLPVRAFFRVGVLFNITHGRPLAQACPTHVARAAARVPGAGWRGRRGGGSVSTPPLSEVGGGELT